MKYCKLFLIVIFSMVILTACSPSKSSREPEAARVMEAYLKAMTEKNEAGVASAVCPDWEAVAMLEFDAFAGVDTTLDGVECLESGMEGEAVLVVCEGKIKASYANEVQEFDLGLRTYRVIPQGQDWQVCGYTME